MSKLGAIKIGFVKGAGNTNLPTDYQFVDEEVEEGKAYYYYLEDIDVMGEKSKSQIIMIVLPLSKPTQVIPKRFRLLQNYPNPFNPETWIPYELASEAPVAIYIYNVLGQLVRQLNIGQQKADSYITKDKSAYWDSRDEHGQKVSSGIYWYRLRAGKFNAIRRMVILK